MNNNYFGFFDESGVLDSQNNEQPFFSVGMLKMQHTGALSERLAEKHYNYFSAQREQRRHLLRSLHDKPRFLNDLELNLLLVATRHAEYKFTNIHYRNLERYKSLLDSAFEYPLEFCALIIDKTDPLFDKTLYKNYWYAYMHYVKILCRQNSKPNEKLCVIADYMAKPNNSDKFFEHEINELPNVFNTIRAHSETFMLLQLCDLLLGSVAFQWKLAKGLGSGSARQEAKTLFVNHLVNKLGILESGNPYPLAKAVTYKKPWQFSVLPLELKNK